MKPPLRSKPGGVVWLESFLRADIDVETAIDLLYAPLYYRLQIGTGPISDAYVEKLFEQGMAGPRAGTASRQKHS